MNCDYNYVVPLMCPWKIHIYNKETETSVSALEQRLSQLYTVIPSCGDKSFHLSVDSVKESPQRALHS